MRKVALTSLAVGLAVASAPAAQAAPDTTRPPGAGPDHTITLITGDKVVLRGDNVVNMVPAPGREKHLVHRFGRNGHTFVVPADAVPLIRDGKVDERLFDVTALAGFGYDDAARETVPLIVRQDPGALRSASEVPALGLSTVQAEKKTAATTWETIKGGGVEKVWLDGKRVPTLDRSVAQIGAPAAWQAGFTGKGVKVAVLDTGVDHEHPDLVGREIAQKNFSGDGDDRDTVGHGTHVAATIASNGPKYKGVAPEAQILDGKVCFGGGCSDSAVLAGMQWAVEQGADVVNMSLGGPDTPGVDLLEEAVNRLSETSGTLFVISAGNDGRSGSATVGSPGSAERALTVGAVERDESIADFSSRGPAPGDNSIKPDVTAPGVGIVAAKSKDGQIGKPVGDAHVAMDGTSMAAPHVAGAAALLKQQHPDWKGAQVKATLMASARPNPALTVFDQGVGRVDVAKALTQTLTVEPGSLSLGVQKWPHHDDPKITKELTYTNRGSAPVTLDLSVDVKVPAGMVAVSPAKLTVPAGGTAKATLTADTTVTAPDGDYVGAIVAGSLRTPFSVTREVESYDLTLNHLDADGKPSTDYVLTVHDPKTGRTYRVFGSNGTSTLRLPKGEYLVIVGIATGAESAAVLVAPKLVVGRDTTVALDARTAKPVSLRTPEAGAKPQVGDLDFRLGGHSEGVLYFGGFDGILTMGHVGEENPEFEGTIAAQFEGAPRDASTKVAYRLSYSHRGRVPTGFERTAQRAELAEMTTTFRAGPPGKEYMIGASPLTPKGGGGISWMPRVPEGSRLVDLVNDDGTRWRWSFRQQPKDVFRAELTAYGREQTLRAGRTYTQRLNKGVHGPALPVDGDPVLTRTGNDLLARVPMFGDGVGSHGDVLATPTVRTVLSRDGKQIGETEFPAAGQFRLPAEEGAYRLESSLTQTATDVSTRVDAAWTFRSSRVDGRKVLPLTVVRFQPKLADDDSTRLGLLRVPIVVQQQKDTPRVRKLEIEVSADDGKTWRKAPVLGTNAMVWADRPGFVSLRAKTTDAAGNTSEVTLIRAYKVTG